MKRIVCAFLVCLLCVMLIACGDTDNHIGEAKTPSASSVMQGRNYQDVVETFEDRGFTNIQVEKIEDLIFGWLTEEGEVEKVSVGGNEEYAPDKWVPADTEVIIYYHTFPTDEESATTGNTASVENKIIMPLGSADYCGEDWTLDKLVTHFTELGFTNIVSTPCAPNDENYKSNIFEIYIATGLFSTNPWEAGEAYPADAEISVYFNESPMLTVDNCPDLVTVLTSKDISYMSFANLYDGKYVEFDAYVTNHIISAGGTSHIIEVTGGNYDGVSEIKPYDEDCVDGLMIRIGDRILFNSINESVEPGDHVKVSGRIDAQWCEYFKMLYVETMSLELR